VRSIIMRFVYGLRMIVVLFCRWRLVMLPTLALRHALTASDEPPAYFLGSLSQHSCILLARSRVRVALLALQRAGSVP
jgi:hypothetical protein